MQWQTGSDVTSDALMDVHTGFIEGFVSTKDALPNIEDDSGLH